MRQTNGFGIVLLVLGVWWLAREFGLIPMEVGQVIRTYWPFALIFIGVMEVVRGNLQSAFFWILVGAVFQLGRVFNTNVWDILWPTLLIWFGLSMVMGKKPYAAKVEEERNEKRIKVTVLFGPLELKVNSKEFEGGSVECILGEVH